MAARDGTGPMGTGPMTGRGLGACTGMNTPMYGGGFGGGGFGRGCRQGFNRGVGRGFGGGFGVNPNYNQAPSKEMLEIQKEHLSNVLNDIDKQLEDL